MLGKEGYDGDMGEPKITQTATTVPTNRIEALSDGVFAIAMTLLVLAIIEPGLPDRASNEVLRATLLERWPQYLSYFVSFWVLGVFWLGHQFQFQYIVRANPSLIWLSLLLLFLVSMVPFTTELVGHYPDRPLTVGIYAANLFFTSLLLTWHWLYGSRHSALVDKDAEPGTLKVITFRMLIAPLLFFVALVMAMVAPKFGLGLLIIILAVFTLPQLLNPVARIS